MFVKFIDYYSNSDILLIYIFLDSLDAKRLASTPQSNDPKQCHFKYAFNPSDECLVVIARTEQVESGVSQLEKQVI